MNNTACYQTTANIMEIRKGSVLLKTLSGIRRNTLKVCTAKPMQLVSYHADVLDSKVYPSDANLKLAPSR